MATDKTLRLKRPSSKIVAPTNILWIVGIVTGSVLSTVEFPVFALILIFVAIMILSIAIDRWIDKRMWDWLNETLIEVNKLTKGE